MKNQLTARQYQVLDFLRQFSEERQRPPTYREIAAHFGFSSLNSVRDHLNKLTKWGWIERERDGLGPTGIVARGIRFLDGEEPEGVRFSPNPVRADG